MSATFLLYRSAVLEKKNWQTLKKIQAWIVEIHTAETFDIRAGHKQQNMSWDEPMSLDMTLIKKTLNDWCHNYHQNNDLDSHAEQPVKGGNITLRPILFYLATKIYQPSPNPPIQKNVMFYGPMTLLVTGCNECLFYLCRQLTDV